MFFFSGILLLRLLFAAVSLYSMKDKIRYIKEIQIVKENTGPDLMAIKARGLAEIARLKAPVLVPREHESIPEDGIYQLDFVMDEDGAENTLLEVEVDVVFRIKSLPDWVKGIKINATENSDIELI